MLQGLRDAVEGRIIDMTEAGILDPLKVVRTALETGASAGVMALTTDALVLTAKRDPSVNPNAPPGDAIIDLAIQEVASGG